MFVVNDAFVNARRAAPAAHSKRRDTWKFYVYAIEFLLFIDSSVLKQKRKKPPEKVLSISFVGLRGAFVS